jgi:hypothetical protein
MKVALFMMYVIAATTASEVDRVLLKVDKGYIFSISAAISDPHEFKNLL